MANQQASGVGATPNVSGASQSPTNQRNQPKASTNSDRLTPQAVAQQLSALDASSDPSETISQVVNVVAGAIGAFGVVYLSRSEEHAGRLAIRPDHFTPSHLSHLRSLLQHVARLANVAAAEGAPQAGKAEGEELLVVAVPVLKKDGEGNEALCAIIGIQSEEQARSAASYLTQMLTWAAAFVAKNARPTSQANNDAIGSSHREQSFYRLLQDASGVATMEDSSRLLADWIKKQTNCAEVVLGFRRAWGGCHVAAYTGTKSMDRRSSRLGVFRELLEETTIAGELAVSNRTPASESVTEIATDGEADPPAPELDFAILETGAAQKLARDTGLAVTDRFPLVNGSGESYGAVLCLNTVNTTLADKILPSEQRLLGQQIALLNAGLRNSISKMLGLNRLGKGWYRHPLVWGTTLAICALMLIPMPIQIRCDCQIQPKQRRFVSVPYEGRLEEVLTEPGEIVSKNQLLARMDGHDIGLELSSLTAELRKAEKDYDTALAAFDRAQSQMASLEAKRLRLNIEALNERLENLEIRSPVDGVVIGGDPRKLEGARLSMGETLLEVGPMDEMIVELEVLDEDISHVELNQRVKYRLDALPWSKLSGTIDLVHPQSETREAANVFVAEVNLYNENERLRPGMRGQAKIRGAYHPLGWNLFHKAWDGFTSWIAW